MAANSKFYSALNSKEAKFRKELIQYISVVELISPRAWLCLLDYAQLIGDRVMNSMGYCVLSLVLGAFTVLQATINGKAGSSLGMGGALIINTSVLILCVCVALMLKLMPLQISYSQIRWWYLWPGFLGFIVLLYLPISIDKVGTLVSFLWCLAGQLLMSFLWDLYMSGVAFSWTRVLGVGISIFGAWLAGKK